MRLLLWILASCARSVLRHHCLYFYTFLQDINTQDITATDAQSPCYEVPCAANETLCDLLSLEGLPDATGKRPSELVMSIRLVRGSLLRAVTPQETLGLAVTAFQMDNTSVSSCRWDLQGGDEGKRGENSASCWDNEKLVIKVIKWLKEWWECSCLKTWQMFSSLLFGRIPALLHPDIFSLLREWQSSCNYILFFVLPEGLILSAEILGKAPVASHQHRINSWKLSSEVEVRLVSP